MDNKRGCIFGLQGSGKTVLARSILSTTPDHLVYDPMREYQGYRRYLPDDRHDVAELNDVIERHVIPKKPRLFVLDEASRYVRPKPTPLPTGLADLNDLSRHWGVAWIAIARRPSQFHTDIIELAHYLFIFGLHGKNDHQYLNSLVSGLGDTVVALPPHHFAVVQEGRFLGVHAPVDLPLPPVVHSPHPATRGAING